MYIFLSNSFDTYEYCLGTEAIQSYTNEKLGVRLTHNSYIINIHLKRYKTGMNLIDCQQQESAHWHSWFFIDSSQMTGIGILPELNLTNLTCKDDFFERNFTCLPRCDRWDERPQNAIRIIEDIVQFGCLSLRILIVGLLLLLFAIRRKAL